VILKVRFLMKNIVGRIRSSFFKERKPLHVVPLLALLPLLGCRTEKIAPETQETSDNETVTANDGIDNETATTNDGINYFELIILKENIGNINATDIITATNNSYTTDTSLTDDNPYDNDELTVTATDDITAVPTISGIEVINFTTSETSLGSDNEFDVNLLNISGTEVINFENSNSDSPIVTLDITNAASDLAFGSHFSTAKIAAKDDTDLFLTISNDMTITTTGSSNNLTINAAGKSITLASSSTTGNITINNANIIDIDTIYSVNNLTAVANGDFSLTNGSQLAGNVNVRSGGTININNATTATGTLTLSNERAQPGSDITLTNANSFGNVSISSVGSITATANDGFAAASVITATAAEDSALNADGVANQAISLNAKNTQGAITQFTLNASSLEELNLGGSSPIVVVLDGADLSTETVASSNSDATLWLSGSNTDLTNVATSVKLRLKNHDGDTLTIKDNQDLYLDAEFDQTASTAQPIFDHVTDATSQTTNAISLKAFDSNSSNSDSGPYFYRHSNPKPTTIECHWTR
jgi:hypothetical protein